MVLTFRSAGGICQGPITINKQNYYGILTGITFHVYDAESLAFSYIIVGASSLEDQYLFRLMTHQNTMVDVFSNERDIWLNAMQSGLELALCVNLRPSIQDAPTFKQPKKQLFKAKIELCRNCGTENPTSSFPIVYFGKCEAKQQLCSNCSVGFGLLNYLESVKAMEAAHDLETKALIAAKELCQNVLEKKNVEQLTEVLHSTQFEQYSIQNDVVQKARSQFLCGDIGTTELLDCFEEVDQQLIDLKKAAFMNCGDMGTAMKVLLEQTTKDSSSIQMLSCVLDFLYTNRQNVGFFWPQLCHIHLRMLPPKDAKMLQKVNVLEDFLFNISEYSIHLALELIWSHSADLEESLGSETPSNNCKKRRYAVLSFVNELESRILGEDVYATGTSISLGKLFQATALQLQLLQEATRDIRPKPKIELDATQKLKKIQKADYLASHINFTRRLADVAEKLRFMEIKERSSFLEQELEVLNASGSMGGDPLNRIRDSLIRVVRIPSSEGHVFRSKERTPVLLLMELVDEASVDDEIDENEVESMKVEVGAPPEVIDDSSAVDSTTISGKETKNNIDHSSGEEATDAASSDAKSGRIQDRDLKKSEGSPLDTLVDSMNGDHHIDEQQSIGGDKSTAGSDMFYSAHDEDDPAEISEDPGLSNEKESNMIIPGTCEDETVLKGVIDALDAGDSPLDAEEDVQIRSDSPPPVILEDAMEGHKPLSPVPKALVRFDSEGERIEKRMPTTPKDDVKRIVNSVAQEQLKELVLPDISKSVVDNDLQECDKQQAQSPRRQPEVETDRRGSSRLGSLSGTDPLAITEANNTLAPTGDIRRAVLTTIMMQGIQGNTIAAAASDSVQRSLKELERKRATALLFGGEDEQGNDSVSESKDEIETESTRQKLMSLGVNMNLEEAYLASRPTEEDEVLEAIRLMLIQSRVAQGQLSPSDAAKVLQHTSLSPLNATALSKSFDHAESLDVSDHPTIDAGDVDPRLAGCGPLPPAVLQAMTLWKGGVVSHAELLELVKKDIEFVKHSVLVDAEDLDKLKENSAFWGRFSFGERWAEKKARIGSSSPQGKLPGWDICGVIVKSNDDLRQEAFVMQLIELSKEAFELAELELWISPYRILATGRTTGVIECVRNAMSFDALKKRPGYGKGGLREHLRRMTEFTADPGEAFKTAQQNFVRSLAAYSLLSYFFLIKDRHNGNLLLDTAGHVIHIDFGFVFGVAPGGSFSLEMSTPFKLTEEMLDVMGGLRSPLFSEFVTLFCCGFLALQSYCDTFMTLVEITSKESTFKCFEGQDPSEVLARMRERFVPDLSKEETVAFALDLIKQSTTSYGTRQYDLFQYLSQGIVA